MLLLVPSSACCRKNGVLFIISCLPSAIVRGDQSRYFRISLCHHCETAGLPVSARPVATNVITNGTKIGARKNLCFPGFIPITMYQDHLGVRIIVCGFCLVGCTLLFTATTNSEGKVGRGDELLESSLINKDHSSPGVQAQSFANWYRQQSADAWFGSATFTQNHGIKKNPKRWLSKQDINAIPSVERKKADFRLKARLVELSMDMLQQEKKSDRLVAALKTKLASSESPASQEYHPSLTEGDFEDLNASRVDSIIKSLDFQFQNRSIISADEFDHLHEKMSPEQKAAIEKDRQENDAAGLRLPCAVTRITSVPRRPRLRSHRPALECGEEAP
jgi:hypothetical protein